MSNTVVTIVCNKIHIEIKIYYDELFSMFTDMHLLKIDFHAKESLFKFQTLVSKIDFDY